MQAILCDVSHEPIDGEAWEVQIIHGRAVVNADTGQSRIVQRDGATVLFLAGPIGRWLLDSLDQLRTAYEQRQQVAPQSQQPPPAYLRRTG